MIADVINEHFDSIARTSFRYFQSVNGFRVTPVQRPMSLEDAYRSSCSTLYLITWPSGEKEFARFRTHPCSYVPDRMPLPHDIQIMKRSEWLPCENWLTSRRVNDRMVGEGTIEQWWDMNGRHFRLLDLPIEVRYCFYESLVGKYVFTNTGGTAPPQSSLTNFLSQSIATQSSMRDPAGNRPFASTNIIATSRQVRNEAFRIMWESTWKSFYYPEDFTSVIAQPPTHTPAYNWTSRISLNLVNGKYLWLLGMSATPTDGFSATHQPVILALSGMSQLRYLDFHFTAYFRDRDNEPSPLQINDPWAQPQPLPNGGSSIQWISCQAVFVDWFLTMALDYIRHVSHISISGHVKNRTQVKWKNIFKDVRRIKSQHDMTAAIAAIKSTPVGSL